MENPRRVYLDHAATTPIDNEVLDIMLPLLKENFGNPSSIHHHGRKAKSVLEMSRKEIASMMGVTPAEIIFTSGGTEADNIAIRMSVESLSVKTIISAPIEHHAVLHTIESLRDKGLVNLILLNVDSKGRINIEELKEHLKNNNNVLVSLMHANNEIGNLNDINAIGLLCKEFNALFHSDTVQTIGHQNINLSEIPIDFAVGAAHKFNGPKGIGFLYVNKKHKIQSLTTGGGQERGMRPGTENLAAIAGMSKALELSLKNLKDKQNKIQYLRSQLINFLKEDIPGVAFNGDIENSNYTVLNVSFPSIMPSELFLFQLDLHGISVSGGSACSSGSSKGSHVMEAIGADKDRNNIRFSFGKYTQLEDILYCREQVKAIFETQSKAQS